MQIIRAYKRKTGDGLTSLDEMNTAVKEVLLQGKKCRTVAKAHAISEATLRRYCAKVQRVGNTEVESVGYVGNKLVFSKAEETMLAEYTKKAASLFYGLSTISTRKLAYQYAMGLNKTVPDPWVRNGMASADLMTAFLKRNSTISLRSPEATSLSRATSFNNVNVANFFNNLESLYAREQFTPDRIWNIDETGCTTVQKPTKIVAATGIKQVGAIVSAQRGQLVTVCCAVSATGNSVPPMFVFLRVNYRDHFVNGAPTVSTGTAHPSGWMTSEGFLTYMKHFAAHVRPSRDDKALVLLDNHESHLSIDVLQYAKDSGIVMLSFPLHCSHKLQPLDRTVYGPLKRYYNAACDGWIVSNKGRTMSIYDIPAMVGIAFSRAMTPGNILSGLSVAYSRSTDT